MKFSVIITNYNYEEFLFEAVNSVLSQTCDKWELIIVDDGSKNSFNPDFPPWQLNESIKVIRQSNRGLPSARNTGIMNATGDWILPLDADDKISPLYLERIAETIKENTDTDVVYCDMQHFGDRTDKVFTMDSKDWSDSMFSTFNPVAYCSAIRKSVLLECGGYNVKMIHGWEDYQLWLELWTRNKNFVHIPEIHFFYRRHGTSMIDTSYKPQAVEYSRGLFKQMFPNIFT